MAPTLTLGRPDIDRTGGVGERLRAKFDFELCKDCKACLRAVGAKGAPVMLENLANSAYFGGKSK